MNVHQCRFWAALLAPDVCEIILFVAIVSPSIPIIAQSSLLQVYNHVVFGIATSEIDSQLSGVYRLTPCGVMCRTLSVSLYLSKCPRHTKH